MKQKKIKQNIKKGENLSKDFIQRGLKSGEVIKRIYQKGENVTFQKPPSMSKKIILIVIVLAIILGIISGFIGGFLILVSRRVVLPFKGEINLDQYLPKREMTVETIKNVTVTPDVRVSEVVKEVRPQIVTIYQKKKEENKDILKQIYQPDEILGEGIILTSDGWLISLKDVINLEDEKAEYVAIDNEGNVYPIKKIIFDPLTDIIFLKIKAKDLPVVKLAQKEEIKIGQEVLLLSLTEMKRTEISQMNYFPYKDERSRVKSVEKFSDFLKLSDNNLNDFPQATPLVNLSSALVGLKTKENLIVPTFYLRNLITQVLKKGDKLSDRTYLQRPSLGINYLDLAKCFGITDKRFKDLREGALVYGGPKKNSPAEKSGLRSGDVILKVNQDNLSQGNNLSELIWQYEPGSTLELTISRRGETKKIKVVLDKIKE